jgi:pimeloyl-ACP methyl ester carboxylesterase
VRRPGEAKIGDVAGAGGFTRFPAWSIIHSRHWKMQIPYLAGHGRVVTFDRGGNGRSDHRRPDTNAAIEEHLAKLG